MSDADDRDRLREAAAGMDDLFEISLPDAPGMTFVGGRFGVRSRLGEVTPFSAGAADEDRERAFRRCVGEMVETRAQFAAGRDFDWIQLDEVLAGNLHPEELSAIRRIAGIDETGLWLPAMRLVDGAPSCLPASLCLRDLPDKNSIATSLGCAAGRTVEEATRSALLELIERDALALWWRGGDEAGAIGEDEIPEAAALLRLARA